MKLHRNYAFALIAALTIVMSSCGGGPIEHGTEYVLECQPDADSAIIRESYQVIEKRLDNFGIKGDYELLLDQNTITIRVRQGVVQDTERLRKLLQASAQLTFRATYNLSEISSILDTIYKTHLRVSGIDSVEAISSGLYSYFSGCSGFFDSPLVACVRAEDTAAVMKILKHDSVDALLPLDLTFHWGPGEYLETGEQTMALLACKKGRNYEMGGENISEAKKLYNAQSGNPSPEITIIFNAAGATAWEKMTSANVGRSLAIEVDNFVYSYPTVVSPITGGLATITGRFTDMEAEQLVLILKSGKMPAPAKIVSETEF